MTSSDFGTGEQRRRPNAEIVDRVAVRRALTDLVGSIESLQREAVFLKALIARPAGRYELLPRIVSLGQNVRKTSLRLETVVAALSDAQREHSRVMDVRRALKTLEAFVPRLPD